MSKRVVIIGMGDTGLLCATRLSEYADVTCVTTKSCMMSGQELGLRLAKPSAWLPVSMLDFAQYRKLDGVEIVHGAASKVEPHRNRVLVNLTSGQTQELSYDVLLIASGVSNGFWRSDKVETRSKLLQGIQEQADKIAGVQRVAVVGGGPSSVSTASNLKRHYPDKDVHLFFSRSHVLPGYHQATRSDAMVRLLCDGVTLHPNHRAEVKPGFTGDTLEPGPILWQTGQEPFNADLVVWAIGQVKPHSGFLPSEMLDNHGFVQVDSFLRVEGHENIFAVGDVAATDVHRSSARNQGYETVSKNIRKVLQGKSEKMKRFKPPPEHRWGSIFGVQREGMRVYTPSGRGITIGPWLTTWLIFKFITAEIIFKGIRKLNPRGFLKLP
jgi:NADH dehydrogenase FAD-containing subunit